MYYVKTNASFNTYSFINYLNISFNYYLQTWPQTKKKCLIPTQMSNLKKNTTSNTKRELRAPSIVEKSHCRVLIMRLSATF